MSNLEKIQKGMRVLQILSKVILIFAVVGVAFISIGAVLVASDVLNTENQFLHFLSVAAEINKGQLVGTLIAAAASLLFGGIITAFVYRYFTAELKESTPFTDADSIIFGICLIMLAMVVHYGAELERKVGKIEGLVCKGGERDEETAKYGK